MYWSRESLAQAACTAVTPILLCDLSLVLVLTCHKKIKNSLILAHSAASHTPVADQPKVILTEESRKKPLLPFRGGGQLKDQPPSSSSFFSLFLSLVSAFLFYRPSDGIPSSVSCCLCELLGNHGRCPVGRYFFSFYWCHWWCWKVTVSAYGWDVL